MIYQSIFDASPDGMLIVDDSGQILLANRSAERMFGYASGALIGLSVERLVPSSAATRHVRHRANYSASPRNRQMGESDNLQGQRLSGDLFFVDVMLSPIELETGRATLCVVRDASHRKKIEHDLHLASAVFQSTQEAIAVTDLECRIVAVNPAFQTVTEYSAEEVLGKSIGILKSGKHDRNFYRQMWHQIDETGEWSGTIWNRRKSGEIYQEWLSISTVRDSAGHKVHYVGISADMTRMNHAETPTERLARYDILTGLPNRFVFQERMQQTIESATTEGHSFAVLYLDLDGFKAVNDSMGHAVGDQLLIHVSERLRHTLRERDIVTRYGGDEFVILLDKVAASDVAHVAQKLIDVISDPFVLGSAGTAQVGLSLGWSLFPDMAVDMDTLLEQADAALYEAKRSGRGRAISFSSLEQ